MLASLYLTTGDEDYIEQTIIDGDESGTVISLISGEGPATKITGFTITNGYLEFSDFGGSGICCVNSSPYISHNNITENTSDWYVTGGGIFCENGSPSILHNTISYNTGLYEGSGIFLNDCPNALIERNVIHHNSTMSGYGVSHGAGIYCGGNLENTAIINNTIADNMVDLGSGGGVYISGTQDVMIRNSIIYNNEPDQMYEENASFQVIYSDIEGGWEGTGNIDENPMFDPSPGVYSLTEDSPCIDAGDPESPLDPDGTRADMGAIYYNQLVTQECSLAAGYAFISTRVICDNPDMMVLTEALIDNETLDFVRNSNGNMLHKVGGEWINNIGDWNTLEGYLFKMLEDDNLCIAGIAIDPQTAVSLGQGYQFISYLPGEPMDALEVFGELLDVLDFVRDSEGKMLWKIGPEWINNIGDMQPGEGYMVKMNGAGELVYPE